MGWDLGAIGQIIGSGVSVYNTAKTGQITADTLNKTSEINDRSFAYDVARADQRTKDTERIIIYLAIAVLAILVTLVVLKRQVNV